MGEISLSAELPAAYSFAVARKAMDVTEATAQGMIEMMSELPAAPAVPKGEFIDVYA